MKEANLVPNTVKPMKDTRGWDRQGMRDDDGYKARKWSVCRKLGAEMKKEKKKKRQRWE